MIYYPWQRMPLHFGTLGSTILAFTFFYDTFRRYCPSFLHKWSLKLSQFFDPYAQITVYQYIGSCHKTHQAYSIIEAYLSVNCSNEAKRLKAEMHKDNTNKLVLSMDECEITMDEFNGVTLQWLSGKIPMLSNKSLDKENKYYKLIFHSKYKEMVSVDYMEHVLATGNEIQSRNRERRLYTNSDEGNWNHAMFNHPATFETIAMKPDKKDEIIEDLLTFSKSKDFYARIGKSWKRGYLLFGPPGTGKSTMIAAIANLLNYDVYDLELTAVEDNTTLRRLLIETKGKSIIVVEDIDCSLNLTGQREKGESEENDVVNVKLTLSGLLNFIDGVWSSCGGERLIIFTTNHVDKLDHALTRRGRMDKHIELSYCEYEGFKVLAKNYLGVEKHPLFGTIEELIKIVKVTPADIAESLMPKSVKEGPEECLLKLIHGLERATEKSNAAKRIVESGEVVAAEEE